MRVFFFALYCGVTPTPNRKKRFCIGLLPRLVFRRSSDSECNVVQRLFAPLVLQCNSDSEREKTFCVRLCHDLRRAAISIPSAIPAMQPFFSCLRRQGKILSRNRLFAGREMRRSPGIEPKICCVLRNRFVATVCRNRFLLPRLEMRPNSYVERKSRSLITVVLRLQ